MNISFEPEKLTIDEAAKLHDALGTVMDVLDGMACQPRFLCPVRRQRSAAGIVIDELSSAIGGARDDIIKEVRARQVTTQDEADRKFALLAYEFTDGSCRPEHAASGLLKLVDQVRPER